MEPPPDYSCPKCDKSFKTSWRLRRHLDSKKPCTVSIKDSGKCIYCGKDFHHPSKLKRHYKSQKGCGEYLDDYQDKDEYDSGSESENESKDVYKPIQKDKNTTYNQYNQYNITNNTIINLYSCNHSFSNNVLFNKFLSTVNPTTQFNNVDFSDKSIINRNNTKDIWKDEYDTINFISEKIKEKLITDVNVEERVIWCTDTNRDRYILYIGGQWLVDKGGNYVIDMTTKKIIERLIKIFINRVYDLDQTILDYESKDYQDSDIIDIEDIDNECNTLQDLKTHRSRMHYFVMNLRKSLGQQKKSYTVQPLNDLNGLLISTEYSNNKQIKEYLTKYMVNKNYIPKEAIYNNFLEKS